MDFRMEDFRGLDPTITRHKSLFAGIKRLLLSKYPFESGGLVDFDLNIFPFQSKKDNCWTYYPPDEFYLSIVRNKYLFCYHSHLHILKPSKDDLFFIKNYDLPLIIYSLNFDKFLSVNTKDEANYLTWPV